MTEASTYQCDPIKDEQNGLSPQIFVPHRVAPEPRSTNCTMSENSTVNSHPSITPTGSPPLPPKDEVEPSMVTPDKRAPTPRPSGGSEETKVRRDTERPKDERRDAERSTRDERETERSRDERKRPERPREERRDAERSEEMIRRLRKEVGDLKVLVNRERASVVRLRGEGEKLIGKCRHREDIIARLEQDIKEIHHSYQGALHEEVRRTQAVEERLKKSEELLATRSAELSVAHTFLSTTDRLSESEVLSIVRDLNENIYQVAVNLTEEWEKLEPPEATNRMDVDPASQPPVPILVQLTRNRDLTGLTLWLQLCLCRRAVEMTSSWGQHEKFAVLDDVYERLSTSGEHHSVDPQVLHLSLTRHRGTSDLSQMEVVDPHLPLPTTA